VLWAMGWHGPWIGPCFTGRHGTKKAHRAVPGPEAKHEARSGMVREARRPVSARCLSGRAGPTSCRAEAGPAHWPSIELHQLGLESDKESHAPWAERPAMNQ